MLTYSIVKFYLLFGCPTPQSSVSIKRKTSIKKKNIKKPTLSVFNAGPTDTDYLYYPLDMEGVTLKG